MNQDSYRTLCLRAFEGEKVKDRLKNQITGTLCLLLGDHLQAGEKRVKIPSINYSLKEGRVTAYFTVQIDLTNPSKEETILETIELTGMSCVADSVNSPVTLWYKDISNILVQGPKLSALFDEIVADYAKDLVAYPMA